MGNRYLAGVEMGLRQRRGLGNNYMSVNVDRRGKRPLGETFCIVNPRGAAAIAIFAVDH
jgi:hypothetical protein